MSNRLILKDNSSAQSHTVRLLLAAKQHDNLEIIQVPVTEKCRVIHTCLTLSSFTGILEYIDEIFPSPPMMPVYPAARAICRSLLQEAIDSGVTKGDIYALTANTPYLHSEVPTILDLYVYALAGASRELKETVWYSRMIKLPYTKVAESLEGKHYGTI